VAWFLFVKPLEPDKSEPASVKSVLLGETGLVLRAPSQETGGMIRFSSPLLGSEDWPIIPLDEVKEGDLVTVVDLLGKSLVVRKS
jgi:membrane protein implicated in regulation of membrane protease activity